MEIEKVKNMILKDRQKRKEKEEAKLISPKSINNQLPRVARERPQSA